MDQTRQENSSSLSETALNVKNDILDLCVFYNITYNMLSDFWAVLSKARKPQSTTEAPTFTGFFTFQFHYLLIFEQ